MSDAFVQRFERLAVERADLERRVAELQSAVAGLHVIISRDLAKAQDVNVEISEAMPRVPGDIREGTEIPVYYDTHGDRWIWGVGGVPGWRRQEIQD